LERGERKIFSEYRMSKKVREGKRYLDGQSPSSTRVLIVESRIRKDRKINRYEKKTPRVKGIIKRENIDVKIS